MTQIRLAVGGYNGNIEKQVVDFYCYFSYSIFTEHCHA